MYLHSLILASKQDEQQQNKGWFHQNKNNPVLEMEGLCMCHNRSLGKHTAWFLGSDSWPCLTVTVLQWLDNIVVYSESVKGIFSPPTFMSEDRYHLCQFYQYLSVKSVSDPMIRTLHQKYMAT